MRAIQVKKAGDASELQLVDCEKPHCGENEVLIEMKAVGINFIDTYIRSGLYPVPRYPYTPGKEGSGMVVETGKNVKNFKVGDRVAFCAGGSGAYAEYVAIAEEQVMPIPEAISYSIAAAAMLQGFTAYYLTHLTFKLAKDHTVLVHAGAGGVGLLLIQIAKAIGAKVITTVSTPDKAVLAKEAGADLVVIYTKESFLEAVNQYTNNVGVDVVYDSVGQTTFDDSLLSLKVRGMLASFGQSSGPIPPMPLAKLAAKSLYLTRPGLHHYTAEFEEMAENVFGMIEQGKLKIKIGQEYSLKDAGQAHQDLEGRKTIGKSILVISK